MLRFLQELNDLLWGDGLVLLLLGTGLLCLFRLCRTPHKLKPSSARIPFHAVFTALGAAMGTGNLAGVASALSLGGAGAVFWMWVAGICGTGLIYTENVLSARFRQDDTAGAAAYLRYGLCSPPLAGIFAVCCVLSSFGMGCMTQTHVMAQTLSEAFRIPAWVTGLTAAVLTAAVILGGAKRIGTFMTGAVPFVSGLYLLLGVIVIFRNRSELGGAFSAIFRGAFGYDAVAGGISGELVRRSVSVGIRRGVFSNEAGLGSSGLLHSASDAPPEVLGRCAVAELAADTFLCCTVTALMLLTAGTDSLLQALRTGIGTAADILLPPITSVFALCTLIGWSFCGSQALRSLTGGRGELVYRVSFCAAAALGACMEAEPVWLIADIANALMAYCNLPACVLLPPAPEQSLRNAECGTS
ncbi:MAG: alanine:cation symporter family protein [Oscillospiraceae bacterium]|nr:alanine:cation symporter family protein [Oscillospiraceae bacterium]